MKSTRRIRIILFSLFALTTGAFADNAKELVDKGIALYKNEQYFEAIDSLRNAIELNPHYGDAYKTLAEVYYALGEYGSSLENALTALKYYNNDPDVLLIVANAYQGLGEFNKAEEYYQDIIKRFPGNYEVYRNIAELYMRMNRLSLSLSMLEKSDRLFKYYWKNYITFGNYYYNIGDFEKAESFYKKAFNLNARERATYIALSEFYLKMGRYRDAIILLETGEKLFDNFFSGIMILADSYLKEKEFEKALSKYVWLNERILDREIAMKSWVLFKMGLSSESLNVEDALAYYRDAMDLNRDNQFLRSAYEYFIVSRFRVDDKERRAMGEYYLTEARDYYKKGEVDRYYLFLKRAISLSPFLLDARRELIGFFEMREDYYRLYNELKSLSKIDSGYKVKDKLESLEWKIKNKKVVLRKPAFYEYKGLVLIDSDFYNFTDIYGFYLINTAEYYNKFKFSLLEYRKKQGINYILDYLRKNDYNFFVIITPDSDKKNIAFTLYDKSGQVFDRYSYNFDLERMNDSIFGFLDWMSFHYPDIFVIGNEVKTGVYDMNAGKIVGISENADMTAFRVSAAGLNQLSALKSQNTEDYYTEVRVVSNIATGVKGLNNNLITLSDFLTKKDLTKLKRILGY